MKKTTIAVIILILAVLTGGVFVALKYSGTIGSKNIKPETDNSTPQVKSETKSYSENNKQFNYDVKADYPEFSGLKNTEAQNKINQDIKNSIITITDQFKTDSKTNCNFSDLPDNPPDWVCEIVVAFDGFNLVNNKILSAKIEYYQFTGGAHGGTTYDFINYSIDSGEKINWDQIFKKDSDYLKIISDYAKNSLNRQLLKPEDSMSDLGWIEEGTSPISDNYNTNVGFNKDGLVIVFQQYQVAAYAAGPQEVTIPYTQLESAINPNGLLRN